MKVNFLKFNFFENSIHQISFRLNVFIYSYKSVAKTFLINVEEKYKKIFVRRDGSLLVKPII